jgi:hypothetical protein
VSVLRASISRGVDCAPRWPRVLCTRLLPLPPLAPKLFAKKMRQKKLGTLEEESECLNLNDEGWKDATSEYYRKQWRKLQFWRKSS